MASFRISRKAVRDLVSIGRYTRKRWGEAQCAKYLGELNARFAALAEKPDSGRPCDDIRVGYRWYQHGRHVVFYRLGRDGVVEIIRVLHERMLPERHL